MPELLIDHNLLVESKDEYDAMMQKNIAWQDKHRAAISKAVSGNSGKWVDSFNESEASVMSEFISYNDRVSVMAQLLKKGDNQLVAMMNRCGDLYNTLDGKEAPMRYPEDAYVTEVSHWVKYSSKLRDTIIDNCETVLADTENERAAFEDFKEIMSSMEYADTSKVARYYTDLEEGLKKQGYIDNFETSLVAYAGEVSEFNGAISSGMAELVEETDTARSYNRSNFYDAMLKKIASEKA